MYGLAAAGFGILFFLLILVLTLGIPLLIGVIVYRDAKSRGMEAMVWALISALAPSLIGVIIYFVVRKDHSLYICAHCRNRVELTYHTCPHCGTQLQLKCAECGSPVQYHWKACTKCGAAQPEGRGPTSLMAPPANNKGLWILLACLLVVPVVLFLLLMVASVSTGSYLLEDLLWELDYYI